ncbi:MAG: hypothetical protein CMF23_11180 [Ignavibacteriae bacterium]|nr:hypothetical protein [Ignavibacteriota bacterium]
MGTIRKTKYNFYQADVLDFEGKRIRKNFKLKADAQAYINMIEKIKYESKLVGLNLMRKRKDIFEAIEEAIQSKLRLRERSIKKYTNVYKQFENFVISQKIHYIDEFLPEHATQFYNLLLSTNAAPKTINFYLMTIKAMFTELVNMDLLTRNPFSHIKQLPNRHKTLNERQEDYFTEDEIRALFNINIPEIYKRPLLALYLTGMRFEELSSLEWDDIDLTKNLITIRTDGEFKAKTITSERDIPISKALKNILVGYEKKCDFVFPSVQNKKLSERTLLTAIKRYSKEAGIRKNATLHKLRHTFSSHLTMGGVNYEIKRYLLGHKPETMTDRYTKIDPSKLHSQLDCLDNILKLSDNTVTKE